ncbi:MAG: hypothetical protein V2B20_24250 [Pseudomonadota bacterium]
MKNLKYAYIALFVFFSGVGAANCASSEPTTLLPENLAAKGEMAASQKTITIDIKEDKPEKAIIKLNDSNGEYQKKGWTVFSILTYTRDGDFKGFFVTYQKSLILE